MHRSAAEAARTLKPRVIKARNGGPFTLDGSRAYLIGHEQVAVIDPGPDEEEHIRALSVALASALEVKVLLTHHHSDHAGAALKLARELGASIFGPPSCQPISPASHRASTIPEDRPGLPFVLLQEGDEVLTSHGSLEVLEVPGHTRDHMAYYWPEADSLFVGDLLLGRGATTWIGEYLESIGDYLGSLDRVESLGPSLIFPGHGPSITSPDRVIKRFRRHRLARLEEVHAARLESPEADPAQLAAIIYDGDIPEKLKKAAVASVEAALFHLELEED